MPELQPIVEYNTTVFDETGPLGYQERQEPVSMWEFDRRDRMLVLTGLVPKIQEHLKNLGHRVVIKDHRKFGRRFAIDEQMLSRAKGNNRRLLKAVQHHAMGQIEVHDTQDMVACMAMISQFFTWARVLIPVAQWKFAWYIREQLNERVFDCDVKLKGKRWPAKQPKCMVTRWQPMNSLDTNRVDVVLLPDPARATQNQFSYAMGVFGTREHRCYSFLRPEQHLGRRGSIRLEAMSGPVIYRIKPRQPAVRVLRLNTPSCPATGCEERSLEWKKKAYWHNNRRNEYVASVAKAFAEKNTGKLHKYGIPFQNGKPEIPKAGRPAVVVLVESVEHGKELLKRLEGWELVDRVPGSTEPDKFSEAKGTIVTAVRAAKDGFDADVVIRATGTTGTGMFRKFPSESNNNRKASLLVVDFADEHDDLAQADTRRRKREYELLGWTVIAPRN